MSKPLHVIVVDDHPIVRRGMVQIISEDETLKVVAEANNGAETLKLLPQVRADVVVSDFDMPVMNGLELASKLRALDPPLPLVLLTMHDDEDLFNEAIDRGVTAYLLKDEAIDNITEGIKAAARGDCFVSPSLARHIMARSRRTAALQRDHTGLASLTTAERAVLRRVAENKASKEIADELGVSYHTISTHRGNISQKLGLSGKHPLLSFALANKSAILSLPE
jgi:DNA-binding NarL/FixJ family response regulator